MSLFCIVIAVCDLGNDVETMHDLFQLPRTSGIIYEI